VNVDGAGIESDRQCRPAGTHILAGMVWLKPPGSQAMLPAMYRLARVALKILRQARCLKGPVI
jgi:hypothetical protein